MSFLRFRLKFRIQTLFPTLYHQFVVGVEVPFNNIILKCHTDGNSCLCFLGMNIMLRMELETEGSITGRRPNVWGTLWFDNQNKFHAYALIKQYNNNYHNNYLIKIIIQLRGLCMHAAK